MGLISEHAVILFFHAGKQYLLRKKVQRFCLAGLLEIYINGDKTSLLMILDCEMIAALQEACWWMYK